ncbi:MAG TPA: imidazolonepropionase [Candidatus Cloacimonadota bacterium]|nr:imidazolonepropionase [Candidatus Cloacimonadota bacterium]HQB40871.1 imidazolonepropionase [Candidatus Cloacimonadota bacterium]
MIKVDTIIKNIKELLTLKGPNRPRYGKEMSELGIMNNISIAINEGKIIDIASLQDLMNKYEATQTIDASNYVVMPGFVDPHTHPVFVNTRENEFEMRIMGKSYVEISQSGGGILSSIKAVREASEEELFNLAKKRIMKMIEYGTTTLEAKSGYGLTTESEVKMLRVIKQLQEELPIDIVATLMGAHEIPQEYRHDREAYIRLMEDEMMPEVKRQDLAEYVDIFTEAHVYGIEESRRILKKAKELGFKIRMHADEIEAIGGAELAGELNAVSADHLGACSDEGIKAMKEGGTVAVLLPATLFSLRSKTYARARDMISQELPVAIATDYNPGSCNCDSMQFAITLSCLQMAMTPAESICAATFNAACSIERNDIIGSVEIGKQADLIFLEIPSYRFIPYHFGSNNVSKVMKKGRLVYSD